MSRDRNRRFPGDTKALSICTREENTQFFFVNFLLTVLICPEIIFAFLGTFGDYTYIKIYPHLSVQLDEFGQMETVT